MYFMQDSDGSFFDVESLGSSKHGSSSSSEGGTNGFCSIAFRLVLAAAFIGVGIAALVFSVVRSEG